MTRALCKELIKNQEESVMSELLSMGKGRLDYPGMFMCARIGSEG